MRLIAYGLATLLVTASTGMASANWNAKCANRSGLCVAYACGTSPGDARDKCFQKCPVFPQLLALQTSNCTAGHATTQHRKKPLKSQGFDIK